MFTGGHGDAGGPDDSALPSIAPDDLRQLADTTRGTARSTAARVR
jgi:hypothetical protein